QHFGRRAVRAALAEVVLDVPRGVEPELVGELDLLDRLVIRLLLGFALTVRVGLIGPRPGDIDLVEKVELHAGRLRSQEQTILPHSERSIPPGRPGCQGGRLTPQAAPRRRRWARSCGRPRLRTHG